MRKGRRGRSGSEVPPAPAAGSGAERSGRPLVAGGAAGEGGAGTAAAGGLGGGDGTAAPGGGGARRLSARGGAGPAVAVAGLGPRGRRWRQTRWRLCQRRGYRRHRAVAGGGARLPWAAGGSGAGSCRPGAGSGAAPLGRAVGNSRLSGGPLPPARQGRGASGEGPDRRRCSPGGAAPAGAALEGGGRQVPYRRRRVRVRPGGYGH